VSKETVSPSIRALLSFLIAPLIGSLSYTIFPLIFAYMNSIEVNLQKVESLVFVTLFFSLPVAYLLMLLIGLPLIKIIETKRPKIWKAVFIYLMFSAIPFILLSFISNFSLMIAQGAFVSAIVTAFIMLFKRHAW
jgi:hypothetical protein